MNNHTKWCVLETKQLKQEKGYKKIKTTFSPIKGLFLGEEIDNKNDLKYYLHLKWSFLTESSQSGISVNNDLP